jgi:hypothetical protein
MQIKAKPAEVSLTEPNRPVSGFTFRKVVTEFIPMNYVPNAGHSHGQILDDMLAEAYQAGQQVQSVEIFITDEDWFNRR